MLNLTLFVSSPGDVAEERAAVRRVITELESGHLLRGKVNFRVVAWDDPQAASPMEAGVTPQDSVNRYTGRPSDCDLTLVILWGRIGTVLPPQTLRADGSRYQSGTVWEFEDASNAHRAVWIYRRSTKPQIDIDDPEFDVKRAQYAAVKKFFDGFSNPDGSLRSGVNQYSDPDDFARQLRQHLEAFVNERLSRPQDEPVAAAGGAAASGAPASTTVPMPALRLPQHPIVGRGPLVDKVLAGLKAGKRDFAFEYLPGVGKTALAAELIGNKEIKQRFPGGVLWAHLGPGPDVRRQLRKWAKALGLPNDDVNDCDGLSDLRDLVEQAIGERRMMLVIDDIWTTDAGQYFMLGGPDCARMITTRHRKIARELMPNIDAVQEVKKLNATDGFQLLAAQAPHAAYLAPTLLHQLVERVDGLPIALVLIGKMLKNNGDDKAAIQSVMYALTDIDPIYREKKLQEYREECNFSLGDVVEVSYGALGTAGPLSSSGLPGEQLRAVLEALSILRPDPAWFTAPLALLVSDAPPQALDDLANAGLIEEVHYGSEEEEEGSKLRYTMHRVVAEYIRTKLSPQRLQELNRRAADYYLKQLEELEERFQNDKTTSYSAMYRYEDPDWQDCQDNWLYYFAQTGYDSQASLSFLRVWFDGFWWWSCFTAEGFDFCDQLLLEWNHKLALTSTGLEQDEAFASKQGGRIKRLIQGLDLLRRFKQAYPKETEDRSGGSWLEVVTTLRTLRGRAKMDGDLAQIEDPHARHVRALTDVFLAEAERFGDGDPAIAEAFYREALALFREAKEDWNIAWTLYHLADMLSAAGRRDEARPLCAEALEFGQREGDYEVIALTHRILGDSDLADGNAEGVLRNYRLALEFAYRFQVEPEDPDSYTIQFYSGMAHRLAGRLLNANMPAPERAQQIARALRKVWISSGAELAAVPNEDALLADANAESLARQLFPPTLPLDRLKVDGAAYADGVRACLAALEKAASVAH